MSYVIDPPKVTSLPVVGGGAFPVRRIFCVGQNYLDHVKEMGSDTKKPPFFFSKPADAIVQNGEDVPYPPQTENLHHEIELVVAIGQGGRDIAVGDALDHVFGAAVGVDLTRRDLQAAAKASGRPWDMAKGFDASAPMGALVPGAEGAKGRIWLSVNGEMRQDADLSDMIWPVADAIAFLSQSVAIAPGDLIMTGTPAGVGPLVPGDQVTGGIDGLGEIGFQIVPAL